MQTIAVHAIKEYRNLKSSDVNRKIPLKAMPILSNPITVMGKYTFNIKARRLNAGIFFLKTIQ